MEWVYFIVGIFIGGLIGVTMMCILQINRANRSEKD